MIVKAHQYSTQGQQDPWVEKKNTTSRLLKPWFSKLSRNKNFPEIKYFNLHVDGIHCITTLRYSIIGLAEKENASDIRQFTQFFIRLFDNNALCQRKMRNTKTKDKVWTKSFISSKTGFKYKGHRRIINMKDGNGGFIPEYFLSVGWKMHLDNQRYLVW